MIRVIIFTFACVAIGAEIDLSEQLHLRNELTLATQKIRPYLYDSTVKNRLSSWLTHDKIAPYVVDCQFHLRPFFGSEKILGPLCYFLRQDDLNQRKQYALFIRRYVYEILTALQELTQDPRYSTSFRGKAEEILSLHKPDGLEKLETCFEPAMQVQYPRDGSFPFSPFAQVTRCLRNFPTYGQPSKPYYTVNLAREFPNHPGHTISETGWVGGNQVEYLTSNDTSNDLAKELAEKHPLMKQRYPLSGRGSVEGFLSFPPLNAFTPEEGFDTLDSHPIWSQEKQSIFGQILGTIDSAQQSIFIDLFFFGGTIGATIAKHIVKLLEEKPGLKVMILRDNYNHYGHETEMRPVFNYLFAYSRRHPEKLVISGAYIKGHQSGLPPQLSPLITDDFLEASGLQRHLQLYGRAISDHSKVLVIDGKSSRPVAFVGSKNLTDASGGICFDDVVKVTGPAAALVLDDYYWDMVMALKHEIPESHLSHLASQGWSKTEYRSGQSTHEMISHILKPFDLLDRDGSGRANGRTKITVTTAGNSLVRTGLNNVDSTRTNTLDQVLQLILFAKKNIFIRDQLLFERNIVLALLKARRSNPRLDVRIILDPLDVAPIKGFPNLLYLDLLTEAGMQVKWKKVHHAGPIHQEYHMKTISADGMNVISGSANKDQTTMYGSFREEQLDIYDEKITAVHDAAFMDDWRMSSRTSEVFRDFDFEPPRLLRGFDGKPLSPSAFIALMRNLVSILFDSKTVPY